MAPAQGPADPGVDRESACPVQRPPGTMDGGTGAAELFFFHHYRLSCMERDELDRQAAGTEAPLAEITHQTDGISAGVADPVFRIAHIFWFFPMGGTFGGNQLQDDT